MDNTAGSIVVYTDGAASGNPGPGGYGAVLKSKGHKRELSGGFAKTTNNRMELMAVIVALEKIKPQQRVIVRSDSKYVVDAFAKGWLDRWRNNGWRKRRSSKADDELANADLWMRLDAAAKNHERVEFEWVKGHAGDPDNERCDFLATEAIKSGNLPVDEGYELNVTMDLPEGENKRNKAENTELTHLDNKGNASMVNVSGKEMTERTATAVGKVVMEQRTLDLIYSGNMPKGDVLASARIAGIMAAKHTADIIPLCHQIPLSSLKVDIKKADTGEGIEIVATAHTIWQTGVEMEALVAVSAAALTIYDMCKAVERGMYITDVHLLEKKGGKSGEYLSE